MTVVQLRPDWPGLTWARHEPLIYHPDGLVSAARDIRQHVDRLSTEHAATHFHSAEFTNPARLHKTYGEWRTGATALAAHQRAASGALSVHRAIAENLAGWAARLEMVAENARRVERVLGETVSDLFGVLGRPMPAVSLSNEHPGVGLLREYSWDLTLEAERRRPDPLISAASTHPDPPRADYRQLINHRRSLGALQLALPMPPLEPGQLRSPNELAVLLRQLNDRAWASHYDMALQWSRVASSLHDLCGDVHSIGRDVHGLWRGPASPLAQLALQRIEGTTRRLGEISSALTVLTNASGAALEQNLPLFHAGASIRFNSGARNEAINVAFDRLNNSYRQIISDYPEALAYDLPFGLALPSEYARAASLGRSPQPPSHPPQPATGDGSATPPVIGGSVPQQPAVNDDYYPPPVIGGSVSNPPGSDWNGPTWY